MANSVLEITTTLKSTKVFSKTNAEISQILNWYIEGYSGEPPPGLNQTQTNQWKLDQAHNKIWEHVKREAKNNRLNMLREQQANLEQQADTETDL